MGAFFTIGTVTHLIVKAQKSLFEITRLFGNPEN